MERFSFLGGVHSAFIDDLYQQYLKSPDTVEPSWRAFFQGYDFALEEYGDQQKALSSALEYDEVVQEIQKEFMVLDLIDDYRHRGHLFTKTNPVRTRRQYEPTLDYQRFGLTENDLDRSFQAAREIGLPEANTLRNIIDHLQKIYCRSIGLEYMYIRDPEKVKWIHDWIYKNDNSPQYDADDKKQIIEKLNEAVAFENFLNTKFVGQKRFSIEGAEALIPALDFGIERSVRDGVREFVVGMAHRGRLNVLSNIFGKTQRDIFSEFEGKVFQEEEFDGDVKYHLGYSSYRELDNGQKIKLNLSPNPSHLEAVNGVVEGIARAKINNDYEADASKVMPILIHGDAAMAGQGVVYEVVQLERLRGYSTGGTLHLVINNQVGFTTNYLDGRSSTYCTDVGKVLLAPVLHVNGDDVEAVIHAMSFAIDYRQKYQRDIFLDLLCYRKYGHNEGDEPRFTQPILYKAIRNHKNPKEIYANKLFEAGVIDKDYLKHLEKEFKDRLEMRFDESKKIDKNYITPFMEEEWHDYEAPNEEDMAQSPDTSFDEKKLREIAHTITELPSGKNFFTKVERLIKDRRAMVEDRNALDWGMAELLAYGTLISDGFNVRISGEDSERGTFSHRHAVLKVEDSEEEHVLLNNVDGREGRFAIYNSPLSEFGVMGFDYGYAMASPESLVVWEAQFGDFFNGAQVIVDQFITAAEDKWKVQNGLVLYLPHGYEGQGAEHSSARLERWLQQTAQLNIQVVNATTPANFFHLLRRQMHRNYRKPLIVMTPKSLLRHAKVVSKVEDLAKGRFKELIDDPRVPKKADVKKLIFVSGKLYYDIDKYRDDHTIPKDRAFVRLEQLYPLPAEQIIKIINSYKNVEQVIWAQEEPRNMGAAWYVHMNFPRTPDHIFAPPASASTAAGSQKLAMARHNQLLEQIFNA